MSLLTRRDFLYDIIRWDTSLALWQKTSFDPYHRHSQTKELKDDRDGEEGGWMF